MAIGVCPNLTLLWSVGNRQSFVLWLCPFDSLRRAFGPRLRPFVALGSHLSLQLSPWSLRLGDSNLQPCGFYFSFQQHGRGDRMEGAGKAGGGEEGRTATCVRTHSPAECFLSGAVVGDFACMEFLRTLSSCVAAGAGGVRIARTPSRRQSLRGCTRSLTNQQLSLRTEHLMWSVLQGET